MVSLRFGWWIRRNERRARALRPTPLPTCFSSVREIGRFKLEPLLVFRIAFACVGDLATPVWRPLTPNRVRCNPHKQTVRRIAGT